MCFYIQLQYTLVGNRHNKVFILKQNNYYSYFFRRISTKHYLNQRSFLRLLNSKNKLLIISPKFVQYNLQFPLMFINQSIVRATNSPKKNRSQNMKIEQKLRNINSSFDELKKSRHRVSKSQKISRSMIIQKSNDSIDNRAPNYQIDRWLKKFKINQKLSHSKFNQQYNEEKFQNILVEEMDELLQKWKNTKEYFYNQLKQIQLQEFDNSAYEECSALVEKQFEDEENAHNDIMGILIRQMLKIDDYKLRIKGEMNALKKQIKILKKERENNERQNSELRTQKQNRRKVNEELENVIRSVENLKKKIAESKDKSYEQKQDFINLNSLQFKIQRQLQQIDQIQRQYKINKLLNQKKKQLLDIKHQVHVQSQNTYQEIKPHIQRKIETISHLRTNINQIDIISQQINHKLEDQLYVIMGLQQKYQKYVDEAEKQKQVLAYHQRYQQIFFHSKDTPDDWQNYKVYINQLVNKHKILNQQIAVKQQQRQRKQFKRRNITLQSSDGQKTQQRFSYRASRRNSINKRQKQRKSHDQIKLPKLIRVGVSEDENEQNYKQYVKNQMKNRSKRKESQFELESVNPNSDISGELIQVEFHQNSKPKK